MADSQPSKYRMTLQQLEASAHVEPAEMVESVDTDEHEEFDPRGKQPDAMWFPAGG